MCDTSGCTVSRWCREITLYDSVLISVGGTVGAVDMCCQATKGAFSKNL
jgi:hypothetical protein